MFIAALFTTAKICKQPQCPSTDEWINKMPYIHTTKHSALKEKEILSFETTWMDLKDIMINEIRPDTKVQTFHDST